MNYVVTYHCSGTLWLVCGMSWAQARNLDVLSTVRHGHMLALRPDTGVWLQGLRMRRRLFRPRSPG
jgi:hypothetical protein